MPPHDDGSGTGGYSRDKRYIDEALMRLDESHEKMSHEITELKIASAVQAAKIYMFSCIAASVATLVVNGAWKMIFGGKG